MDYSFLGFKNKENIYKDCQTRLLLKCNLCGRIWDTTTYDNFVHKTLTCDGCNKVWKMEKDVELLLREKNIKFKQQKKFSWLKYKNCLFLDFYLPKYNIAIECQGRQHFEPVLSFGGEKTFQNIRARDKIKKELCEQHGIKIVYFSNEVEENNFLGEKINKNIEEILNELKKYE